MPVTASRVDRPIMRLAVTWLVMVPMFFFACRGILWFQGAGNGLEGTGFQSTAAPKGNGTVEVLVFVFACVFFLLATQLLSVVRLCWSHKIFAALAVYALSTCLWSQFPRLTLQFGIYIVLDVLFVFYLYSRFSPRRLIHVFLLVGWIIVLSSIFFALALPQYGIDHRESTSGAWQGVFVYKQPCSIMCTFLVSPAFYLPLQTRRDKLFRTAYITLAIFLILMTQSRTGWLLLAALLAYVIGLKFIGSFRATERGVVAILLFVGLSAVVLFGAVYYREILLLLAKDPTLTGRTGIWKLVIASAVKRPILGFGYRAFWTGLQGESAHLALTEGWSPTGAHNGFLDVWLNLGLVGLGIVFFTLARALRDGFTCLKQGFTPTASWYLSLVFLTTVVNSVEYTIMIPNYLTWMMYILACVGLADEAKRIRTAKGPV